MLGLPARAPADTSGSAATPRRHSSSRSVRKWIGREDRIVENQGLGLAAKELQKPGRAEKSFLGTWSAPWIVPHVLVEGRR